MKEGENILGCFIFGPAIYYDADQKTKDLASEQEKLFPTYIWGEKGICNTLKKLKREDYGKDLELVLFQFYVSPLPITLQNLKEIESYRKKEKSIGVPIIINNENFFSKSKEARFIFLQESILQKLDLVAEIIKRRKLDTKIDLLKSDLENLFKTKIKQP
jgi:hypothetical protein